MAIKTTDEKPRTRESGFNGPFVGEFLGYRLRFHEGVVEDRRGTKKTGQSLLQLLHFSLLWLFSLQKNVQLVAFLIETCTSKYKSPPPHPKVKNIHGLVIGSCTSRWKTPASAEYSPS